MQIVRCGCWLLLAVVIVAVPMTSFGQVAISVSFGPPALPVYAQPICPAPGYIWVPGYWAWDPNFGDYYWVPGTWVLAPEAGYLWTPSWWGWSGGAYIFHAGYWGPTVGFYGGINYGWGYFGHGYEGGRWNNGQFYYNRTVNNINVTNIHNVYNVTVVNNNTYNHVSYNGGPGGVAATPTAAEQAAERERHMPAVAAQTQHLDAARANPQLRASVNQGRPPIAATPKPTEFKGSGVVPAKAAGAPYHPPAKTEANGSRGAGAEPNAKGSAPRPPNETTARPDNAPSSRNVPRPPTPIHAANLPTHQAAAPTSTANTEAEKQYQQHQQQLATQENAEHEKLAQQQEQEHQKMAQQQATNAQIQQMERQHQEQTRQLQESHQQQERQMQRQAPPPSHTEAQPSAPPKH